MNKKLIPPGFELPKYLIKGHSQISYSDWFINQTARHLTNVNYADDPGYDYESDILKNISAGMYWAKGEDVSVDFPPVGNLTTRMIRNQLPEGSLFKNGDMDDNIFERYFQCYHPFVNFGYSDKLLVKEFERWLKDIRQKYNAIAMKNHFRHDFFINLVSGRIIPYIDVYQWNKLHGRKVGEEEMMSIIFPGETKKNLAIIQTTKKNAEFFLRLETSYGLNVLVAEE